ncbi:MAG: tetratricopeptide repeat protein [Thermodesulfobacteriota bacterium]
MKPTLINIRDKFPNSLPTLVFLIISLIISGCATTPPIPDLPPDTAGADSGGNHYYHFIRSAMESRQDRTDQAIDHMSRAVADRPDSVFLKKELVYLYLQSNNTEKAMGVIAEILAVEPDDIGTLIVAGTIKKQTGHDEEAAAIFEKVLTLNPDQETVYHVLGEYYLEKNDLERAAAVYEQMTGRFPESWEAFFFLGKIQARQKKFAEAEKSYRRCLELEKSLISPRFELIVLYRQQFAGPMEITVQSGDTLASLCRKHYRKVDNELKDNIVAANPHISDVTDLKPGQKLTLPGLTKPCGKVCQKNIIHLYNSILADYPDNARAVMELALFYYSIGNVKQGDTLLVDLGRNTKTETAAQQLIQQMSQVFINQQRYDDAQTVLKGLLRGAPENSDLNYLMGMLYNKQQRKPEALSYFSRVKEDSAFYTSALLQMAFLYEETDSPEQAQAIFDSLLEKEPENVDLILYAGSFRERREQYQQAEALFLRGLNLEPDNVDLLFRLGVIYDKTGRKDAVIEKMKAIIKIAPDDANALNYLGYTYADLGINLDEARQLIEKALTMEPDNGYITDSLGWVYYQQGDYEKAIELLKRALQLTPDDPILLEHLGDAFLKNGDTEKALETYRRSLQFAPEKDKGKLIKKIEDLSGPVDNP